MLRSTRKIEKTKIELYKTLLSVLESPASPPEHEKGPVLDTPMHHSVSDNFHASFHIQDVLPYADLSKQRCQSCIGCGKSIDDIKQEKINWYMERSTPKSVQLISQLFEEKPTQMGLMPAAYFFWHPQCRRLPPVTGLGSQQPHMDKRQQLAPSQSTNRKLISKLELFTLTYQFPYVFVFNGVSYFPLLYANTSLIKLTIRRFKLNVQKY